VAPGLLLNITTFDEARKCPTYYSHALQFQPWPLPAHCTRVRIIHQILHVTYCRCTAV